MSVTLKPEGLTASCQVPGQRGSFSRLDKLMPAQYLMTNFKERLTGAKQEAVDETRAIHEQKIK